MSTVAVPDALRSRAVAFALLARSLGADPAPLGDRDHLAALRAAVDVIGDRDLIEGLDRAAPSARGPDDLARVWVRWFDLGRVPPYEGSNVAVTAGGITPRLADVAGFYRAFGMSVAGDRPDHVVAELEFLAWALIGEDEALRIGDRERAATIAAAIRSFVRDHAGTWLDGWAARVAEIEELAPWAPFALAAARLVALEAALRNVVPVTSGPAPTAEGEGDPVLPECGGGSLDV